MLETPEAQQWLAELKTANALAEAALVAELEARITAEEQRKDEELARIFRHRPGGVREAEDGGGGLPCRLDPLRAAQACMAAGGSCGDRRESRGAPVDRRAGGSERFRRGFGTRSRGGPRASLGLQDGDEDYTIEDVLIEVPIWRPGKTAKNWLALIAIDPLQSGGLDRQFARKAKGDDYLYIVPDWHPGDAVEFGADSRNERCRWYGYVVRIGEDHVVLHKCLDGKAAVRKGKVFAATIIAVAADTEVTA